ncbi:type II toxin-antitoxin system Phd/YefM family antitoxin [Pseudoruegeria sp. SK021]|uniref:type II toxin-antitoxin system Phd/YefM family antitoxin n=1 Tax=Pseudoruegeria sp. SK021 TaxID=1933035 RepID=UPI000A25040C|nr:type II toxin-antitoxin system Phd/YefM family antitoxin [Pseudoruegeria sp. SK021]OSP53946.1 prevent-host-death protein [Pseudoruegeria sp. SK021]
MWTVQDAKNKFSAVVDAALAGTPQQVTRRGKPAVVVMSVSEYDRLLQGATLTRGGFVAHLLAFPAGASDQDAGPDRTQIVPRDVSF